eukprot:3233972-Pyramimonas_sp.AAC.1
MCCQGARPMLTLRSNPHCETDSARAVPVLPLPAAGPQGTYSAKPFPSQTPVAGPYEYHHSDTAVVVRVRGHGRPAGSQRDAR